MENNVQQNVKDLDALEDTLCGGNKDFILWSDPQTGLLLARTSDPFDGTKTEDTDRLAKAFRELREFDFVTAKWTDRQKLTAYLTSNLQTFDLFAGATIQDHTYNLGYGAVDCDSAELDVFPQPGFPKYLLDSLSAVVGGGKEITGCAQPEMLDMCDKKEGGWVRVICPTQCGCNKPLSGLLYGGAQMGCPRDKCLQSLEWTGSIADRPCFDSPLEELSDPNSPYGAAWKRYWNAFAFAESKENGGQFAYTSPWTGEEYDAKSFAAKVLEKGCTAIVESPKLIYSFCMMTPSTNSITTFCPQTCGCMEDDSNPGCPSSCASHIRDYKLALDNLPCKDVEPGFFDGDLTAELKEYHLQWHFRFGSNWKNFLRTYPYGFLDDMDSWFRKISADGCHDWVVEDKLLGQTDLTLTILCHSWFMMMDVSAICPELCNCQLTGKPECPTSCGTGIKLSDYT